MANNVQLPIIRLFPNIVTLSGLCMGLFGLKYAMQDRWEMAVIFIIISSFIDGMDGRLARMLNATSPLGAQLDSLADFFNFAVAPALVLYMWKTHEIKALGWGVSLFFIICGALRLARFNAANEGEEEDDLDKKLKDNFFVGVAAPCGAGLALVPMMVVFLCQDKWSFVPDFINAPFVIIYMSVVALLMVSRIPTLSIKKMSVSKDHVSLALAIAGFFVIFLIIEPWITLPLVAFGYFLTIPISVYRYNMLIRAK